MKIGIMTFWWSADNYGQQMQAWALQRRLKDIGHEPFLIRYIPTLDYQSGGRRGRLLRALNPKRIAARMMNEAKELRNKRQNRKHPRGFDQFREMYLAQSRKVYYSLDELRSDPPEADMYICGSDQIWNYPDDFGSSAKVMCAFFLDFGDTGIRRISYAASFGRDEILQEQARFLKPLLARFERVSVREPSGIRICAEAGRPDALCVPDPTLLLPADAYRQIMQRTAERPRYCFLYIIGNSCDVPLDEIKRFCRDEGLAIEYTASQYHFSRDAKTFPTVTGWLSLIEESDCVITNSFHGVVFSIIFNKPFTAIPLKGGIFGKMNNRIQSVLEHLGCSDKIFDNSVHSVRKILKSDFPWKEVNRRVEAMSRTFLDTLA